MRIQVNLHRPDMCVVLDEVGCNLNMTKDGHTGGTKFVVGKDIEAKTKATKREKHFTCLGLTALSGEPIMCVVIIDQKREDILLRTGVDVSEHVIFDDSIKESDDKYQYLLNNLGPGKQYPGGPSCIFNGKEIPCMVELSPGGGMTGKILTNIFKTLDELQVFERTNGKRPFILLDGHATRFDCEFLNYVNDDQHRWSVCIGVLYGTSLWQVGDSVYQNGRFKIRVTLYKEQLLQRRNDSMSQLELIPYDIIPIVNYAWQGSFDNLENNRKAILDRGWWPLNRMLLLHPDLHNSMTTNDYKEEREQGLFPNKRLGDG
jgi:hypothetical protein